MTVPWTERVRYGAKKNGYHGGVTPQEVIVPLRVSGSLGAVTGWRPTCPFGQPGGRRRLPPAPEPAVWRPVVAAAARLRPAAGRPRDRAPTRHVCWRPTPPAAASADVDRLFASPTYQTQTCMAARVAPDDRGFAAAGCSRRSPSGAASSRLRLRARLALASSPRGGLPQRLTPRAQR